ncbi:MAG: hypothetical protein ACF8PN_16580 [Phycisphaerales bacterium]
MIEPAALGFDRWEMCARVESDRYCEGCGYNIRSQPVRRDPRTEILLIRCPECERFEAARDASLAGRTWMRRVGGVILVIWICTLLWLEFGAVMAQVGMSMLTLDETTNWTQLSDEVVNAPGFNGRSWRRVVSISAPEDHYLIWFARAMMGAIAFAHICILAVVLPHWRRVWLAAWSVGPPILVGLGIIYLLSRSEPDITGWISRVALGITACSILGGLIAVVIGRALARGAVRTLLPAGLRSPFAYLWECDGLEAPTVARTLS